MDWTNIEPAPREPDSYGLPSAELCLCGRMMFVGEEITSGLCSACFAQGERDLEEATARHVKRSFEITLPLFKSAVEWTRYGS